MNGADLSIRGTCLYSTRILRKLAHATEIYLALKIEKKKNQLKNFDIFLIFAQIIDCRYTLQPPRRGGSNKYSQSMFWSKIKKNMYTPQVKAALS